MGGIPDKRSAILLVSTVILLFTGKIYGQYRWRSAGVLPGRDAGTCYSIAYGNGRYVSTGQSGTIFASPDSIGWFGRAAAIPDVLLWSVTFTDGSFVTTGSNTVLFSTDGVNWGGCRLPTGDYLIASAFGNGTWVTAGTRGTVFTSINGKDWTDRSMRDGGGDIYSVCFGKGRFVAICNGTVEPLRTSILSSADGAAWKRVASFTTPLWKVICGDDRFVAVGDNGTVITSTDGREWTAQTSPTTKKLNAVAGGNNAFVAAGEGGTLLTSKDGYSWVALSSPTDAEIFAVVYGKEQYVAVGEDGSVFVAKERGGVAKRVNTSSGPADHLLRLSLGGTPVYCTLPSGFSGGVLEAKLFDITGRQVFASALTGIGTGAAVTAVSCAPGAYFMRLTGEGVHLCMPVTVAR